jgi:hypothetical protein
MRSSVRSARSSIFAGLMGLAATVAPAISLGNGRFPFAQHVIVAPREGGRQIVLRTTFGLLWSRDDGRAFDWACEQSMGFEGNWDPAIAFGAGGAVLTGLPDGASMSAEGCDFSRISTIPTTPVIDLASSVDGMTVYAVESVPVARNRLFVSLDGGRTFLARGQGPMGVSFDTVELAPSNARRVYVTGVDENTRGPVLFRSDDGGATLAEAPLPAESLAGATGAFVSAVAAADPDTLFVRVARDGGTHLLRSRDAGRSWTTILRARGELRGFALATDGRIWAAGPEDPLARSDDGGDRWTTVSAPSITCLRHVDGVLYLCADWVRAPWALGRLADGASTIEPLLRLQDARGAFACGPTSTARTECAPRWAAQRDLVTVRPTADASLDAAMDASLDGPATRVDAASDRAIDASVPSSPAATCRCSAPGAPPRPTSALCALSLVAIACTCRRRSLVGRA